MNNMREEGTERQEEESETKKERKKKTEINAKEIKQNEVTYKGRRRRREGKELKE